jgi:PilZ domain-containing protein
VQPQALSRAVRNALEEAVATPGLRGDRLVAEIESLGARLGLEPFRACLRIFDAGPEIADEARSRFEAIEAHRTALESRLLRDPGFAVAAADYLHASGGVAWTRLAGRSLPVAGLPHQGRTFDACLAAEIRRHQRTGRPLALVLLSPETLPGENAWSDCMTALLEAARDVDHIVRIVPEGVAAILPCTGVAEAVRAAARLRGIAERVVPGAWHCGVAALPDAPAGLEGLAAQARAALDEARREHAGVRCAEGERRRHGRRPAAPGMAARVSVGHRAAEAEIEDVSLGGILIRTPRALVPGLRVGIAIGEAPPRARRLALEARVVRSEAPPPGTNGSWRAALRFDARPGQIPALADILAAGRAERGGS